MASSYHFLSSQLIKNLRRTKEGTKKITKNLKNKVREKELWKDINEWGGF